MKIVFFLAALSVSLVLAGISGAQILTGASPVQPGSEMAAAAAPALAAPQKDPVEITADDTLEWHRNAQKFIARGNALAKQADMSIAAATLTAFYAETAKSNMDIQKVTADDDVVIHSRDSRAYGDNAVYELDKGFAVMTGKALKMTSPDQVLTARDRFEYYVHEGRLVAIGDVHVERYNEKRELNILDSDKATAILKTNARGQRVLHTMEAQGNVVITTPTEIVRGAYGIYYADTNMAELRGGVTITRGPNILQGERAEVDLNTNTSQLFGGPNTPGTGGRVRGVFYPENNSQSGAAP